MSYIRSGDAAIYFEEYGAGETLILLPELFGTIELDWRRFIPDFSRHFHVIAVDLRGHGRTNNPSGALHHDQLMADLLTLFDTLEIERAFLCTHGEMGNLALMFAIQKPERLFGLILHSPRLHFTKNDHSPPSAGSAILPPFTDDVLQRVHAPANGPEGWVKLRAVADSLFRSAVLPDRDGLWGLRVPILVTCAKNGDQAGLDILSKAVQESSITLLPQSGQRFSEVRQKDFLDAVTSFSRHVLSE